MTDILSYFIESIIDVLENYRKDTASAKQKHLFESRW